MYRYDGNRCSKMTKTNFFSPQKDDVSPCKCVVVRFREDVVIVRTA